MSGEWFHSAAVFSSFLGSGLWWLLVVPGGFVLLKYRTAIGHALKGGWTVSGSVFTATMLGVRVPKSWRVAYLRPIPIVGGEGVPVVKGFAKVAQQTGGNKKLRLYVFRNAAGRDWEEFRMTGLDTGGGFRRKVKMKIDAHDFCETEYEPGSSGVKHSEVGRPRHQVVA